MVLVDGREHFQDKKGLNRITSLQQHLDKAGWGGISPSGGWGPVPHACPAVMLAPDCRACAWLAPRSRLLAPPALPPFCFADEAGGAGCGEPAAAHWRRGVGGTQQVGGRQGGVGWGGGAKSLRAYQKVPLAWLTSRCYVTHTLVYVRAAEPLHDALWGAPWHDEVGVVHAGTGRGGRVCVSLHCGKSTPLPVNTCKAAAPCHCRRTTEEYVLDFIVERKSVQDLASSITAKSGRYERQKVGLGRITAAPARVRRPMLHEAEGVGCLLLRLDDFAAAGAVYLMQL